MEQRLIDANALKEILSTKFGNMLPNVLLKEIDNSPTITPDKIQALMSDYLVYRCEPERPKGEWIKMSDRFGEYYACNVCGYDRANYKSNFCPNCGAYLRGSAK